MPVRDSLRLAVAQPRCAAYDVGANAATHALIVRTTGARVVVFPELSLTGYELDAPALTVEDARLRPIVEACAGSGALALVGAPLQGATGQSYIAMLSIDGTGARVAYRKMWLSTEESRRFTPGSAPAVLDVDGWRLGLAICKDTSMPQHVSATAAPGMDAYVAGTLMFTEETPIQAERARRIAVEHHVWVALASFAGPTGGGYARTAGRSGIWTASGAVLAQAGPAPDVIAQATLA